MVKKRSHRFGMYRFWLNRKQKEFADRGYPNVKLEDLINYLDSYRWKRQQPDHYIQAVRDILSLTPNDYFNYATLKAQVYDVKDMDDYDLSQLF